MNGNDKSRQDTVRRAWRATLRKDPVSDHISFFDSGGNSLLVVTLQRHLSEAMGYQVPLRRILKNPTVAAIAGLDDQPLAPAEPPAGHTSGLNLYCLPYAGCSARVYDSWQANLPEFVNLRPVELPGRGSRWPEPAISDLAELLDDLSAAMTDARTSPYVVFGHSFGGVIAYELVRHLAALEFPAPRCLVVSGCPAPHLATPAETTHDLSDEDLTQRLRDLKGTPPELLDNAELMELYIPIIRADYVMLDNYRPPPPDRLDCPILAFYGDGDAEAEKPSIEPWADYTTRTFTLEQVTGDHFFLHAAEDEIVAKLGAHLAGGVED